MFLLVGLMFHPRPSSRPEPLDIIKIFVTILRSRGKVKNIQQILGQTRVGRASPANWTGGTWAS